MRGKAWHRRSIGSCSLALFEAGHGGQERGTREPRPMRRSLYVQATKRPVLAAAAATAGVFLGSAILSRGR